MDVLPNVESNVTLGYTALMDVPPNVQFFFCYLYLKKTLGYTALMGRCAT